MAQDSTALPPSLRVPTGRCNGQGGPRPFYACGVCRSFEALSDTPRAGWLSPAGGSGASSGTSHPRLLHPVWSEGETRGWGRRLYSRRCRRGPVLGSAGKKLRVEVKVSLRGFRRSETPDVANDVVLFRGDMDVVKTRSRNPALRSTGGQGRKASQRLGAAGGTPRRRPSCRVPTTSSTDGRSWTSTPTVTTATTRTTTRTVTRTRCCGTTTTGWMCRSGRTGTACT